MNELSCIMSALIFFGDFSKTLIKVFTQSSVENSLHHSIMQQLQDDQDKPSV